MSETPDVRPGSVWADNDPRSAGRTLRVERIEDGKAVCTVLTNSDKAQWDIDRNQGKPAYYQMFKDTRGRMVRIKLSRFKPTSTGYRLVEDAAAMAGEDAK